MTEPSFWYALGILFLYTVIWLQFRNKNRLPLPPGPPGLPLLGNMHQTPPTNPWEKYKEWSDEYGPLMTLNLGRKKTFVISSHQVVHDLLEKKSAIYSSRPQLIMYSRLSCGLNSAIMPYGKQWRDHRALQAAVLRPWMTQRYTPLHDVETKQMIFELLSTEDFTQCFKRLVGSLFLTLSYGKRVQTADDPRIRTIEELIQSKVQAAEAVFRGTGQLVEFFPFLQYLPAVLAPWKTNCDQIYNKFTEVFLQHLIDGLNAPSWTWSKEMNAHKIAEGMSQVEVSYALGSLFEASLTTVQILRAVVLVSILYPDAVATAQSQIGTVVGPDRLPTAGDSPQLSYIGAFIKETMRWRPFAPLGAPREGVCDQIYNGYWIPKGTTLMVNHWALDYDEKVFPEPFTFKPERWIKNPDSPLTSFGFGQRSCPGRHFAESGLALAVARLLWAYRIEKKSAIDINAMTRNPSANAFFSPIPGLEAKFTVRDAQRRQIIEREWMSAEKQENKILEQIASAIESAGKS